MNRKPAFGALRAVVNQQFTLLWRYPVNMVANFLLALVTVIVVTWVVVIFSPPGEQTRLRDITFYGFIMYLFLSHTLWSIGVGVYRERMAGTLAAVYLSPVPPYVNLAGRAIVTLGWTAAAAGLGMLAVRAATGPLPVYRPGEAALVLVLAVLQLVGLGVAVAGLALWFGDSIEIVANVLEFGLMGLCAFFYPFAILPPPLMAVARFIPLSYAVDAFRTVALGSNQPELAPLPLELGLALAGAAASLAAGYLVYKGCEYRVRQQGML
ncbi:MAG: ABC transporter permease [Anaerolineae bacterium]